MDQHNLRRFMSFGVECQSAHWDEAASKWKVVVRNVASQDEKVIWADGFVYAVGRLNNYKIPKIPGQDTFQGKQIHTANWPVDANMKDKNIIVIGNGASAVQCTAALQPGECRSRGAIYVQTQAHVEESRFQDYQHCSRSNLDRATCVLRGRGYSTRM